MADVKPRSCLDCSHAVVPLMTILYRPGGNQPSMRFDGDMAIHESPRVVGPVRCRKFHWLADNQRSARRHPSTRLKVFKSVYGFLHADNEKAASDCPDYDGEDE